MSKPYPGYSPSYRSVDKTGGCTRSCFVVEFLSLGTLEPAQKAMIEEQLSAMVAKLATGMPTVEKSEVIVQDRFDRKLLDGLRLSST